MKEAQRAVLEGETDPGADIETKVEPRHWGYAARLTDWLLLVGGVACLGLLLYALDTRDVLANVRKVGWGILLTVAQEIFAYIANAAGWYAAFARPRPRIPPSSLLAARIAGDAINYLTPTGTVGGEFVRARMLRGRAPMTAVVASVMVAKLSQPVALAVFIVACLLMSGESIQLPPEIRSGVFLGVGVLAVILAGLVLAQRRGMLGPALRALERVAGEQRTGHRTRSAVEHLDEEVARIHASGGKAFFLSVAFFALGWLSGTIEIYLILWFLGLPVSIELALLIEALAVAFDALVFFVPLRLGTQEAGKVLIFTLLGFGATIGLTVGILCRVRELFWATVGLAILWRSGPNR